jgi:O-antigen/teichoic acid export membrane protein
MSLTRNVIANYGGQGWRALMQLAFIPLYIKYLGIEAYGLIGIFAILQACLGLLDSWMKPALSREMARFTAGAHSAQSIRDLLRSIELIGIAIAGILALGIWVGSTWLASHWIRTEGLSERIVAEAIAIMGAVTALRVLESIYVSSIVGLQRQVLENLITGIMATARGLGVLGVMAWVSPTIEAFLVWQGLVSLSTVALFAGIVHRILPPSSQAARFSSAALIDIRRFAAGMMAIAFLALLLTQVDKILLSRLLTLQAFAYYAFAGVVANGLYMLVQPLTTAFYPRFAELVTRADEAGLNAAYHQGAQLVSVFMGTAAVLLMVFGDRLLLLWTRDPALVQQVAPLTTVLALGTLLNGLMWMPYQMQLAHGRTALTIRTNLIAVAMLIPAILWVVPKYGAIGAAGIWVTLNLAYLLFSIHFMHRHLLPMEKWRWYREDVIVPIVVITITALLSRLLLPNRTEQLIEFGVILVATSCTFVLGLLAAPAARKSILRHLRKSKIGTAKHFR